MDQQVTNLTSIPEDEGSIPGLAQWLRDLALLWAAVQDADSAWIWCCYSCGIGRQRQLWSDPQPRNFQNLNKQTKKEKMKKKKKKKKDNKNHNKQNLWQSKPKHNNHTLQGYSEGQGQTYY